MHTRKRPVISHYGEAVLSVGAVLITGRWLREDLRAAEAIEVRLDVATPTKPGTVNAPLFD